MKIDTGTLGQLKAFNDFAKDFGVRSAAVAKLDVASGSGGVVAIARNTDDTPTSFFSPFAFFRGQTNKGFNDDVRSLFREAVARLFGGEENLPPDVRRQMEFNNYGKGRPLTARRIAKVNTAVINALLARDAEGISDQNGNKISAAAVKAVLEGKMETPTNARILSGFRNGDLDNMPQDILDALAAMKDKINARCGPGTVQELDDVVTFVGTYPLKTALETAAKGLVRDLNGDDLTAAMDTILERNSCHETAKLVERLEVLAGDLEGAEANKAIATAMYTLIPGLLDGLKACRTPDAYKRTLDKFQPQIKARMEISAALNACEGNAADILFEQFRKMTGLDPNTLSPPLSKRTFLMRDVEQFKNNVNKGKGNVKTAADVKNAFVELARNFVKERQELAKRVAEQFKGLPAWTLEHLRRCALVAPKADEFIVVGFREARGIDLRPLKTAISAKPFAVQDAIGDMLAFLRGIYDIGDAVVGHREWAALGLEGQQQFAKLMIKTALAGDTELVAALESHAEEIQAAVHRYIEGLPPDDIANKNLISVNTAFGSAIYELASAMP